MKSSNRFRAQRARNALIRYGNELPAMPKKPRPKMGDPAVVVDLLTDLMHLAGQNREDFDALLGQARSHFTQEVKGKEP